MRLSRISACSIYSRAMRIASVVVGCCSSLWRQEQVWDNNCVWPTD